MHLSPTDAKVYGSGMRWIPPLALIALAACFHDAGPAEILPATSTSTSAPQGSSTGPADSSTSTTSTTTTDVTTTGVTTTGVTTTGTTTTTGPSPPFCGDAVCDPGEDCDGCAMDCGDCPLGVPPGGPADPLCVGDEGNGGPTCNGINNAYTSAAVNVGYYPYRIKAGVQTALHTCDDRPIEALGPGQGFAAQSTRNPGCSDNPPLREPVAGFVFGYVRGSGLSGWVPADALEFSGYDGELCADGPGNSAWQVTNNPHDGCRAMPCEGVNDCAAGNPVDPNDPEKLATECIGMAFNLTFPLAVPYLALYAAPDATPMQYIHQGDEVKFLWAAKNFAWVFVELKTSDCPTLSPVGLRGWIEYKPEYFGL